MDTEKKFQPTPDFEVPGDIDFYEEEKLNSAVSNLFSEKDSLAEKSAEQILHWTEGGENSNSFIRVNRINEFERALSKTLRNLKKLNWPVFKLLAEMEEHKASVFGHLELLQALGKLNEIFTPEIKTHLEALSQSKNLKDQVLLHEICDLLEALQVTEQFGDFAYDQEVQARVKEIYEFTKTQAQNSDNFLISNHWNNIAQTYEGRHAQKPGIVSNVPGGSSDYIIAIYNEFTLLQSYYAGIITGKQNFSPEKPLLPIGEKYLASYDKGRVTEFCQQDPSLLTKAYEADREMVTLNDPQDNHIYSQLNQRHPHEQGRMVSDFFYKLQKEGRDFYFNVINSDLDDPQKPYSKVLNPQTLHPETLANILSHNYQLLVKNNKLSNSPTKNFSPKEFLKLAFPTGLNDPDKGYLYLYMLGLTSRKAVEENLGENLANLPPYGQAALLEFLTSRNKQEFQRVVNASDTWGNNDQNPFRQNFLLSFLSLNEDPENQEVVLSLAEQLPKKVSARLFDKYSEIVTSSQEIQNFINTELKANPNEKTVQKITSSVFKKANALLKDIYAKLKNDEEINYEEVYQAVHQYRTEVAVLASALRNIKGVKLEDIENSSLDIKDSSKLTNQEKTEMLYAFKANRDKLYPGGLKEHTAQEFEKKLNEPGHSFYVYNYKDHPSVFFHVDEESKNTWYIGSLNLGPEATDSPLAVEVIKSALEQEGGIHNLRAEVYENNPALKFYTRILGFKLTGKEHNVTDQTGKTYKYLEVLRPKSV